MKLKPIVPLMSLIFAATLTGCNLDGSSRDSDSSSGGDSSGGGSVVETSPLADGYWDIGSSTAAATLSGVSTYADAVDLPNVYVFDGTTQYYYDDDATPGTYVIKGPTSITEDINAGTLTFTYYDASGETPVDGTYSVSDSGELNIDTAAFGTLSGTNESGNDAVKAAVTAANADAGIELNNVVQILDTNKGGAETDTGELRLKIADSSSGVGSSIASGKVTVDLILQADDDSAAIAPEDGKSAYISLWGEGGTSNSNLHGEIGLTTSGDIKYRDAAGAQQSTGGTFTLGEKLSIEAEWSSGVFTFTINGTTYTGEVAENTPVETIAIKLGDNSSTNAYEVLVDNFKVYNGTTVVFDDNFDNYPENEALDGTDDPYNNNSAEATVIKSDLL